MEYKNVFILFAIFCCLLACASESNPAEGNLGRVVYKKNCKLCHGIDGKLQANGSKDLTLSELNLEERIAIINKGRNVMPPFEGVLSEKEIKAVAEYTRSLK